MFRLAFITKDRRYNSSVYSFVLDKKNNNILGLSIIERTPNQFAFFSRKFSSIYGNIKINDLHSKYSEYINIYL
jgi:hypothetical protein